MPKQPFQNPKTKIGRFILGWSLVIGGAFGFLPVLGFWMIPLGLLILSTDYAFARRWRRKLLVWIGKRQKKRNGNEHQESKTPSNSNS
ncbi:PGPGW domain-containing protein [Sneathiella litorea]|uniref:Transmembrane protein (PGPGW) n=1 Tax=Sneathiella litorea TaxID=2606216 RepID=A0A6L8W8G5_9PROT|nr:hypothetical protein [Sneathiella litorea]